MSDSTASPKPPPPPPPPPVTGAERPGTVDDGGPASPAVTADAPVTPLAPPSVDDTLRREQPDPEQADTEQPDQHPTVEAQEVPERPDQQLREVPASQDRSDDEQPGLAAGRMRAPWRVALSVAWGVAILALSSVWQVSVQIGHSTWWLGPAGEPNNLIVQLLPFFGPVIVLFLIIVNVRGLSWWASLFAVGQIAIGAIDLSIYRNLGLLEIAIGTLLLLVSLASAAGRVGDPPTVPASPV